MGFKQSDKIIGMEMHKPGKLGNSDFGGQMAVHILNDLMDIPLGGGRPLRLGMIALFLRKADVGADKLQDSSFFLHSGSQIHLS